MNYCLPKPKWTAFILYKMLLYVRWETFKWQRKVNWIKKLKLIVFLKFLIFEILVYTFKFDNTALNKHKYISLYNVEEKKEM